MVPEILALSRVVGATAAAATGVMGPLSLALEVG